MFFKWFCIYEVEESYPYLNKAIPEFRFHLSLHSPVAVVLIHFSPQVMPVKILIFTLEVKTRVNFPDIYKIWVLFDIVGFHSHVRLYFFLGQTARDNYQFQIFSNHGEESNIRPRKGNTG